MGNARTLASFCAGAVVSTALWTAAAPQPDRFRSLDAFAQALTTIASEYVEPTDERELLYDAIAGMTHNLDLHSTFLRPRRYQRLQEDTEGEFGDVGLALERREVDPADPRRPPWPRVTEVVASSPAQVVGVQVDDLLVAIDGQPTAEIHRSLGELEGWRARLRGATGTRVRVSVLRTGWRSPKELVIVRTKLKMPTVRQRAVGDVGVLSIARFSESTAGDARLALAALGRAGAAGLVLDLRDNPGGVVDQAVAVADLFLERGTIVTIRQRRGSERRSAHPGAFVGPVVVLVDGGTASAAEIVAAALGDNHRATIAGEPTYGKGTVQTLYDLVDGAGLKITTGRYYTPAGNQLESNGIQPHVKLNSDIPDPNVPRMSSSQTPSASAPNGATIARGFDDDPQLVAAVALARNLVRGWPPAERRGPAEP
jgi:carboxyl-terminal processing protease